MRMGGWGEGRGRWGEKRVFELGWLDANSGWPSAEAYIPGRALFVTTYLPVRHGEMQEKAVQTELRTVLGRCYK